MRMTIKFGPVKQRKKPAEGDIRIYKGRKQIRKQQYSKMYEAWLVNANGSPKFEWVDLTE